MNTKAKFYLLIFALTFSSLRLNAEKSEPVTTFAVVPPMGVVGADLSAHFAELMASPLASSIPPDLAGMLKSYLIVIVPGFKNQAMGDLTGDFADEMAALKAASLKEGEDFMMMKSAQNFSGIQPAAQNAVAIAKVLQNSSRPVLLVTQSKGSVDVLEALIASPELQSKVHGWFSIQGALWGTRIADTIESSWKDRTIFHDVIRALGGSPQAIIDLEHSTRGSFMEAHQNEVEKVAQNLKVISFASWKDYSDLWWPLKELDTHFFPGYQQVQNDGVMMINDTLLPNSDYIVGAGIDHGDSTLKTQNGASGFNRKAFMRTILSLLLGSNLP